MILKNAILATIYASFLMVFTSCENESAIEQYTEDKILVIGNNAEPQGLDPQNVTGVTESNIIRSLFEGLCMEHPSNPNKSNPGAAKSWTSDSSSMEWVFNLHKDGKWSDGTPLTAQDFIFAYHRILHPTFGAKYSSMLYFIKGAEDYNKDQRQKYLLKPLEAWSRIKEENYNGDSELNVNGKRTQSSLSRAVKSCRC